MPTPQGSQLFLVDRSRYEDDNRCPRLRYERYHSGPYGCGIDRKAKSVPLVTGGSVHAGLAHALLVVSETDQLPTPAVVDAAVKVALEDYNTLVDNRGLSYWEDSDEAMVRLIEEQRLLVEGLVRAWLLWQLPSVLRDWQILHVEEEHVAVVDCTCELGDRIGGQAEHDARGCHGIGLMGRADFVGRHRVSRVWSYHEFKTTSGTYGGWKDQWETTIQPQLGTVAIEASVMGIEIEQIFIHGLLKGKRDHEYDPATGAYTGPEYQNSRLVNAYFNTAAPEAQEWAVRAKWTDETGKQRKLPNSFKKYPVSAFGPYQEYLETFADDLKESVLYTLGPIPRKDNLRHAALEGWIAHERQNRAALWEVADVLEAHNGNRQAPEVQKVLNGQFRRTYVCQPFGKNYGCPMIPLCHEHAGWENPELMGYVDRYPHHKPELEQLRARGLEPPRLAVEATTGEE